MTFNLNNKRNDGFAVLWVIFEFFLVVSVFAERPNCHLVHAGGSKNVGRQALRHDRERKPSAKLKRVIWTRHKVEESSERVRIGNGNLTN